MDSSKSLRKIILSNFKLSVEKKSGHHLGVDTTDLTAIKHLDDEFKNRTNEKEEMQGLNTRLSVFIKKVHDLEQTNKALEAELKKLQSKPSHLDELYQNEMRQLRSDLEETQETNNSMIAEIANLKLEQSNLREKYDKEVEAHTEAQAKLKIYVNDATKQWLNFETKIESLKKQISFLEKINREMSELNQTQKIQVSVERDEANLDLTSALNEIRSQYESLTIKNMQSNEVSYKSKSEDLSKQVSSTQEQMQSYKEELTMVKKELQAKSTEIHSLKASKKSLEKQLEDMDEQRNEEITSYQEKVFTLETELTTTKENMAEHLSAYKELLNVKIILDLEIAAYRVLLEGGEKGIGTFSPISHSQKESGEGSRNKQSKDDQSSSNEDYQLEMEKILLSGL